MFLTHFCILSVYSSWVIRLCIYLLYTFFLYLNFIRSFWFIYAVSILLVATSLKEVIFENQPALLDLSSLQDHAPEILPRTALKRPKSAVLKSRVVGLLLVMWFVPFCPVFWYFSVNCVLMWGERNSEWFQVTAENGRSVPVISNCLERILRTCSRKQRHSKLLLY